MAEKCTKTSSPVWRLIKPYPLASLNHLTVPCSIFLYCCSFLKVTLEGVGKNLRRFLAVKGEAAHDRVGLTHNVILREASWISNTTIHLPVTALFATAGIANWRFST